MQLNKLGKNFLLFFLLPLLASICVLLVLDSSTYNGTHTISYNLNSISIKRDEYGIPTIESQTYKDVSYGLGFAHAQDRLWTVFFRKLLFSGRLSQFFGIQTIPLDTFMRSASLERYSHYAMAHMNQEVLDLLQAYVDGFNEAVNTTKVLPLEFWITSIKYEPLQVIDVITAVKGISFLLTFGYQSDTIYTTLENLVGEERAKEILPHQEEYLLWNNFTILNDEELKQNNLFEPFSKNKRFETPKGQVFPKERRPPTEEGSSLFSVEEDSGLFSTGEASANNEALRYMHPNEGSLPEEAERIAQSTRVLGSNAWVIHGNFTTTGKPILANDPHLTNGIPSFWYNAALIYGDDYVTGVSIPGAPFIIIGKTKHVAWGFTANLMNSGDLYNITVKDRKHYLYEGKWYRFQEFYEHIKVRNTKPASCDVYETHHGVVIDPYFLEIFGKKGYKVDYNDVYSLAWMGFTHNDTTISSFYKLLSVKTADEMISIWENAQLGMNLHFATSSGDIGYLLVGSVPIRRSSEASPKPLDGSKAENDWIGWIPWEDQPRIINPEKGFIVSANNKIASNNIKWQSTTSMFSTTRAVRIQEMITEMLDAGKKISIEDVKRMQLDTVDILARDAVPVLIKCTKEALKLGYQLSDDGSKINKMLEVLEGWNYNMNKESVPATVFAVWETFFLSKILGDFNMTDDAKFTLTKEFNFDNFVYGKLLQWTSPDKTLSDEYWCKNNNNTNEKYPCLYNIIKSLEETWTYLEQKLGGSLNDWQWMKLHREDYTHTPLSLTVLKIFFHRSVPCSGNGRTVKVSHMSRARGDYDSVISANVRMVMSVGEEGNSYAIIDTGISGKPQSSHYTDQMKAYHNDKWLKMSEGSSQEWSNRLDLNFRQ